MTSEEVQDFECKMIQTFALGQPALAKVVLEAYRSEVNETTFKQSLLNACSKVRLGSEFQSSLATLLRFVQKKVNFLECQRHWGKNGFDGGGILWEPRSHEGFDDGPSKC